MSSSALSINLIFNTAHFQCTSLPLLWEPQKDERTPLKYAEGCIPYIASTECIVQLSV